MDHNTLISNENQRDSMGTKHANNVPPVASTTPKSTASDLSKRRRLIRSAQTSVRKSSNKRIESLGAATSVLRHVRDQVVAREAALHQAQLSRLQQLCAKVDASTAKLMKAFAEVQSNDLQQLSHKRAAEERKLQCMHDERAVVHLLRLFGAHLTLETNGRVRFKQLDRSSQQFERCVRATEENTNPTLLGPDRQPLRVKVVAVFKIEHASMLQIFQQAARSPDAGRIKGLFCSVPAACVPRLVAFGMFDAADQPPELQSMFENQWFTLPITQEADVDDPLRHPEQQERTRRRRASSSPPPLQSSRSPRPASTINHEHIQGYGWARRSVAQAEPLQFPRWFSRYSTLEELSDAIGARDAQLQFAALCRVLPGEVRVVEGDGGALRSRQAQGAAQTTYWSQREEYTVGRPSHVMPEFLIAFRIDGFRDADADAGADADAESSGVFASRVVQDAPSPATNFPVDGVEGNGAAEKAHSSAAVRQAILHELDAALTTFWQEFGEIIHSQQCNNFPNERTRKN